MRQDRIKWNEKFRRGEYSTEAAGVVQKFYQLAAGRKALDIAAGSGRNAVFLAGKGFSVEAVDISEVGLRTFAGAHPSIDAVCADLDRYEIAAAHAGADRGLLERSIRTSADAAFLPDADRAALCDLYASGLRRTG